MAKKKRRKVGKRTTRSTKNAPLPGWIYLFMGLSVGLAVAFGVYVNDRQNLPQVAPAVQIKEPASTVPAVVEKPATGEINFDFYELLPNLDVEVYEDAKRPARMPRPAVVRTPGIYLIQAGSFSRLEDANRRKAEMALLGVKSEIRKGLVKDRTVFRVYTKPMEQPADVNRTSDLLIGNGIEIMLKRVSD